MVSVGISIINYTRKARAMQFWLSAMESADRGTKFVAVHFSVCIQPVKSIQCLFPSLKFIATYFRFISLFKRAYFLFTVNLLYSDKKSNFVEILWCDEMFVKNLCCLWKNNTSGNSLYNTA